MEIEILKYILDNQGAVVTSELLFNLGDSSTTEILCNGDKFVTCFSTGTPQIVAQSSVRVCWRKDCGGCGALHLCKGFLLTGSCQFSQRSRGCIFSHNILSSYNEKILTEFGLETLTRAQLCLLLLQSNTNLLPAICYNYNSHHGCQDNCQRLHICERFLSHDCSCFRTHDFMSVQPLKVLQDKKIPACLFTSLKSIYANKVALRLADKAGNNRNKGKNEGNYSSVGEGATSSVNFYTDNDCSNTVSRMNQNKNRGRGGQGRRGNFRGGKEGTGVRHDLLSCSDQTAASLSFVNSYVQLNDSSHNKSDFFDGILDCELDKAAVTENGAQGHGRNGENTGARGGRGKNIKSGGMQAAGNKVDWKPNSNKTEICMYFIKGHCKHEDQCFKAHSKMPYVWEMNQDGVWSPMAENERIEESFCNPGNTYSTTNPLVYFDTMKCGENKVRRLSTINSVQEPHFIHTTDWLWYWEDNSGKWLQYGANTSEHQITGVTSRHLEEMYLKNGTDVVQFKAGNQSYELSFPDMIQTNIQYSTKRVVRRRPKFVSAVEARTKRKPIPNPTGVPEYWDKTQVSATEHRCIDLQPSQAEYKEIQNLFKQTMKEYDILKIERIQNQMVWEAFQLQKNHMKNKNKGQAVSEKKLFHGTEPTLVKTICATNLDWRLCGVNGTVYGQGTYFARDAKYSHSYNGSSHVRFMFVSRVLVGEYTRGHSNYKRPPSKDGSDVNLYDSCVDDIFNPSIFVVFEKQQIYPEYVLQYQPTPQPTPQPSSQPTYQPASQPTYQPSSQTTPQPSSQPTYQPASQPTYQPSSQTTPQPSSQPTYQPASQPTYQPSSQTTPQPSSRPTYQPTPQPTSQPTSQPTPQPSSRPTYQPTPQPASQPTYQPAPQPSSQPTPQRSSQPSSKLSKEEKTCIIA